MRKGIVNLIYDLLLAEFVGKENAKSRFLLLGRIKVHDPGMKDRTMRRIYGKILPVGWCEDGIYVIDSIAEVEKMIKTETRRRDSIEDKLEMLHRHRHFLIAREKEKQTKQMALF